MDAYKARIAETSEIQGLRERWNELVLSMQLPSVFCTWEWMTLWWKHFGHSYRPLLLLIFKGEVLVGILPLALRTMIIEDGVTPGRALTLWGSIDLHSDHLDIIAGVEDAENCLDAALRFLGRDFRGWDVLHLSHVSEESCIFRTIRAGKGPLKADFQNVSVSPYIAIAADHGFEIDNYLKSLGRKRRQHTRREMKNLYEKDKVAYMRSDPADDPACVEVLFELHESRSRAKGQETTFSGKKLMDFHAETARIFGQQGWLRLRFLKNGDAPLAAMYCFSFAGRWLFYQSGLDPKWRTKSAGSVLLYSAIEEAFKEHADEFDFLRGSEAYKDTWTGRHRGLWDVRIYNSTLAGLLFKGSYRLRSILKGMIKKDAR